LHWQNTTIESVRRFAKVIIHVFGPKYIPAANKEIDGNQREERLVGQACKH
jgi:hypothetical protein